jgi:hypothetical protein
MPVKFKVFSYFCLLTLCCNVGTFLVKGIGKGACASHEGMGMGESVIAPLIYLSARGK